MAKTSPGKKGTGRKRAARDYPAKPNQVTFAPSILSCDFANIERELKKVERAGCQWVHVDVMDNHFVPNLTLGPPVFRSIVRARPNLFYDTHLMVEDPLPLAREFIRTGSSNVTIHLEACQDPVATCRYLRRRNVRVGVSLRPKTPLRLLEPVLKLVDLVLVMTVEPGFGGQELMPKTITKIRDLKHLRDLERHPFLIQIDGGVKASNVQLLATAGAEVMVAGTAIFRNGAVAENLRRLRTALSTPPPPDDDDATEETEV